MNYMIVYAPGGRWDFRREFDSLPMVMDAILDIARADRDVDIALYDGETMDALFHDLNELGIGEALSLCVVPGRLDVVAGRCDGSGRRATDDRPCSWDGEPVRYDCMRGVKASPPTGAEVWTRDPSACPYDAEETRDDDGSYGQRYQIATPVTRSLVRNDKRRQRPEDSCREVDKP